MCWPEANNKRVQARRNESGQAGEANGPTDPRSPPTLGEQWRAESGREEREGQGEWEEWERGEEWEEWERGSTESRSAESRGWELDGVDGMGDGRPNKGNKRQTKGRPKLVWESLEANGSAAPQPQIKMLFLSL